MPRSYEDPCGIARALNVIGDRWALLVVRELVFGPKRFTDLRDGLSGASPNVLSQRLRELEAAGVVVHDEDSGTYALSARGTELHPILIQLGAWGARSIARPSGVLSVDALMIALQSTFSDREAGGLRATYELRVDGARFSVDIREGSIAIARGASPKPDAVIDTDGATLRALAFGDAKLADAKAELTGDKRLARAFFRLFKRPLQVRR